jgi:hypothetical protein
MTLSLTDYILWLTCLPIQLGVVLALFRRGLHKEYPYFYSYMILSVLGTVVLWCVVNSPFYFYAYWVIRVIGAAVSFAVLYEVFQHIFRLCGALRGFSIMLFRSLALVLVLISGMLAITPFHPETGDSILTAVLLADRIVSLMQCGLALFLLLVGEYLGLSRHRVWFGIALGFGLYPSVRMFVVMGMLRLIVDQEVLNRINSAAGDVTALIWLAYTVLPLRPAPATMRSNDWNPAQEDARDTAR